MTQAKQLLGLVLAAACFSLLVAAAGEKVQQVDSKYVCMVNKRHFDNEQMQVNVEGKTYYVCCNMCKAQLLENPAQRTDVDPVSGNAVDKAIAVVGVDKAGNVYFFESVQNLEKFRVPAKSEK